MTPIASAAPVSDLSPASERLVAALREPALVVGKVTLSSGAEAEYYVDAKRATLLPAGFRAMGSWWPPRRPRPGRPRWGA